MCVGGGILFCRGYCWRRRRERRVDEMSREQLSTIGSFLESLRLGYTGHATVGDWSGGFIYCLEWVLTQYSEDLPSLAVPPSLLAVRSGRAVADKGRVFTSRWTSFDLSLHSGQLTAFPPMIMEHTVVATTSASIHPFIDRRLRGALVASNAEPFHANGNSEHLMIFLFAMAAC